MSYKRRKNFNDICVRRPPVARRPLGQKPRANAPFWERQDYNTIKAECLRKGELWVDPEFPPVASSLFPSHAGKLPRNIVWKRPWEITDNPELFVGGASRFDICQGELGDCWFLAAIACLSMNESLLFGVVPPDQSFDKGDYVGCFRFNFWHYGTWTEVVVDDQLPTFNNRLTFVHSAEENEYWSALLEKAYAKLYGSYEALKGGSVTEAMEDFTGGVTEGMDLRNAPKDLLKIVEKAMMRNSLMGCSVEADPNAIDSKMDNGLVMGHAYSITGLQKVNVQGQEINLIRVRNPWGSVEWMGDWSDESPKWDLLSSEQKAKLNTDDDGDLNFGDDGEFWMDFEDWRTNFTRLEICNLPPDAMQEDDPKKKKMKWVTSLQEGKWQKGATAGGCRNFPDTFWINPQYRISLDAADDPDPDDDEVACSVIIALMQRSKRAEKVMGTGMLTIGFAIYELEDPDCETLKKEYFMYHKSVARSPSFINTREICGRYKLPPAEYVIIPSTFEPGEESEFMLRIYTEKSVETKEIDDETQVVTIPQVIDDALPKENLPVVLKPKTPKQLEKEEKEKAAFTKFFESIAGEDMEIDAFELKKMMDQALKKELSYFEFNGFNVELCRSMVALMDDDKSGMLGLDEFFDLWSDIKLWTGVFKMFDADKSGDFDTYELRLALEHVGFKLKNTIFQQIVLRYQADDQTISFPDFIALTIRLKAMFKAFASFMDGNKASLGLEDWLTVTMYC
ncbi:calpain-9-like isoform X1 [Branchiostoma floridae]|uniref:Calpain-9-like isoform X1 n=1 Tax=Branchiostoma floridae TaxID=7739 RepID=A0A9J7MCI2_BRAFL|nr:calpain-9-like isoform X1 [Branchiostoma floridae]